VPEEELKKDAKEQMIDFIKNRFSKGKDTKLQDIQDMFKQAPWELSEGSVINYLNELVEKRKISTWKTKTNRYYGPPKIPLPIKTGIAISAIIIGMSLVIDIFIPSKLIYDYIYFGLDAEINPTSYSPMFPIVTYLIILTFIITLLWWIADRRKSKSI